MADEIVYDFGIRLRELRKQRGMSCAALAQRLGVSKETVYRYEGNVQTPSLERAKQIAAILNTSLDYLVGLNHVYTIAISGLSDEQKTALNEFLRVFVNQN
jgi:transcriptional regulator with XRE-family HTH domain